ncbi:MAG TPA: hypothetical protein VJ962_09170 [Clostridia bacterium]|nr:hypothetical protein [Clostridia bacterium]
MITEKSINQYEKDLYNNYDQQVKNQVMIVNSALENYLNESPLSEKAVREESAIFISQMSYEENGNFIDEMKTDVIAYEKGLQETKNELILFVQIV